VSVPALAAGRIAYVASRVQVASEPVWRRLAERHAGTVQAAVAEWRLAELALRVGKPAEADGRLRKAADALRQSLAEEDRRRAARERVDDVFVDASPLPSARYQEEALFGVEELLWLMRRNSVLTDPRCAEALASLLDVDEQALTAEEYYRRLSELAGRYEDTALAENIKLAVARATKDPKERLEQLLLLARQQADPDAAVEADFELGRLALWEAMRRLCPDLATPRAYFQRVADGPSSPWQPSARERLAWLEATSRPAG